MEAIKQTLFTNWNTMRWIRLGVGIFMVIQAIQFRDSLSAMIAIILLFQALTNTGCCGVTGCSTTLINHHSDGKSEIEYEEVSVRKYKETAK